MGQIEADLFLKARSRFRRYHFDRKLSRALENTSASRYDSTWGNEADIRDEAVALVKLASGLAEQLQRWILKQPGRHNPYDVRLRNLMRLTRLRHADNLAPNELDELAFGLRQL